MNLETLLSSIQKLEKQLIGIILGSWLFSTVLGIAQYKNFDTAFISIISVLGGIAGTAAILPVYLSKAWHPSKQQKEILEFQAGLQSYTAFINLGISAAAFYGYYYYASLADRTCVIFLAIGTFFFFRTIANTAITILIREQQEQLWNSMSQEQRDAWLNANRELEKWIKKTESEMRETKTQVDKIVQASKDNERSMKKEMRKLAFKNFIGKTYNFRKIFGLVTLHERVTEIKIKKKLETRRKFLNVNFHLENASRILKSEIQPIQIEKDNKVQYYLVEDTFRYFVSENMLSVSTAKRILEAMNTLEKDISGKFENVILIIPAGKKTTHEGIELMKKQGVKIVEYQGESQ